MSSPVIVSLVLALLATSIITPATTSWTFTRKKGYCMWYGQCGISSSTHKPLNCFYNGKAKNIPDQRSRDILFKICPELVEDDRGVCCDHDQLVTFESSLQSARQLMARCPACWMNFRQLYCQMTCSPDNSLYVSVTSKIVNLNKTSIASIDYYVDRSFRDGLYNSCKDVLFPNSNNKIMSFLCGISADKCNPLKFLRFMGDPVRNGQSPFPIGYPANSHGHPHIKAMNVSTKLCNETVREPSTNKTENACSCQDCLISCDPLQPGHIQLKKEELILFTSPFYRTAMVAFTVKPGSKYNNKSCYENFMDEDCTLTGPVLRKQFLFKVLDVQNYLTNMLVKLYDPIKNSSYFTLEDICAKPPPPYNNCVIVSALQYWQNDAKKLNVCIGYITPDCSAGDIEASWGDHLIACANDPYATDDGTALHQSCVSSFGEPVAPSIIFGKYEQGNNYADANALIVTFVMKEHSDDSKNDKVKAWEKQFAEYMKNYYDEDLEVVFMAEKSMKK